MREIGYALLLLVFFLGAAPLLSKPLPEYGQLGNFSLIERSGKIFGAADLSGKIWIADFVFTRCGGPCPMLSSKISHLQKELPSEIRFVTFSIDPDYDTPKILSDYAQKFVAEEGRWFFLTGKKHELAALFREKFHVGVQENHEAKGTGDAFIHSIHFVLVDGKGTIRGYYQSVDSEDMRRLSKDSRLLLLKQDHPTIFKLPALNALLNALCAVLLLTGFSFIRTKKIVQHKICMASAFVVSTAFLTSYLIYHYHAGSIPFQGQGWIRPVYFGILISHTILAAVILPMALVTFYRAWKENFEKHVKIARWTLPIWLYVSMTGITVYWMLYQWG